MIIKNFEIETFIKSLTPKQLVIIGAAITSLSLIIITLWGIPQIISVKTGMNWPNVTGRIVESRIIREKERYSDTNRYIARIAYRYEVQGKEYFNNRISFGGDVSSKFSNPAYKITKKYPMNKVVKIFYDPSAPKNSVLDTGVSILTYVPLITGILLIFIGTGILYLGIKK